MKTVNYALIEKIYDEKLSLQKNLEGFAECGIEISRATLYNYCKDKGISTGGDFVSYVDPNLSVRANIEKLSAMGFKVGKDKMAATLKELRGTEHTTTQPTATHEPTLTTEPRMYRTKEEEELERKMYSDRLCREVFGDLVKEDDLPTQGQDSSDIDKPAEPSEDGEEVEVVVEPNESLGKFYDALENVTGQTRNQPRISNYTLTGESNEKFYRPINEVEVDKPIEPIMQKPKAAGRYAHYATDPMLRAMGITGEDEAEDNRKIRECLNALDWSNFKM